MLQFDTNGYLTPDRNISSTLSELEQTFKINNIREDIYNLYLNYSNELKNIIGKDIKQWVDGSYVTKKNAPEDIDILTFIDYDDFEKYENELNKFFYPNSKAEYNIDAYIIVVYPNNHKKNFYYRSDYANWLTDFSKDFKTNTKKGFLEIVI
ncbi:hypothetical protein [Flavobacterium sp. MDT1-60]|uniref:DUF6932 family protein n=1 Tax=Flavobacterium sp. MDT1-60 TaxID=1979344 RepID=UPI00177B587B|nr:hypothetical protein [Flavobacterium sp. MDT1-60]QOG01327.1 hypothetical protein IHE43_16110 [Flavobacterium sp. MDT1-60]